MHRLRDSGLAAMLTIGLTAGLGMPAAGQAIGGSGLLRTPPQALDGTNAGTLPGVGAPGSEFGLPTYGNPPGSGAGATGFVSSGAPRRKKGAKPKPGEPPRKAAAEPSLLPTGAAGLRLIVQERRKGAPVAPTVELLRPPPALVAPPRRAAIDPTPFDPTGIRIGAFVLRPAIETTVGYDSNPERIMPPRGSGELMVAPEFTARSDWERHALNADFHGNYLWYDEAFPQSPTSLDRPTVDARVSGRIDISSVDRVDAETRYLLSTDNPGSPNIQAGLVRLPLVTTVGGTLGYTRDFNRIEVSLKTTVDRSTYQDSSLTDGSTSSNDDRNFNQYAAILRGSYDLLPGVKPFVETTVDTRIHDVRIDRTGADRDSVGVTVRAGTTFQLTGKLSGEISFGQTERDYRDPTLPSLKGPVLDGNLIYAATALTTVKFTAASATGELILPGASGVLRRDYGVEVDHDFRRWLTGIVKFGYGADTYVGFDRFDNRYLVSAGLTYKLNRDIWLRGEVRREWLRSTITGADSEANIVLLTVRVQR